MAETSTIEWTHSTANPWRGCTKISEGCTFCYADRQSNRNPKVLGIWGPKGTRVLAAEAQWRSFRLWNEQTLEGQRHLVFCASLADIFEDWPGQMTDARETPLWGGQPGQLCPHPERPFTLTDARARLWRTIRLTPRLTWQLLTKRPENILRMMPAGDWPNVWLGTSIETQEYVWRADALQEAAERVRVPHLFVSAEPLLGPLNLSPCLGPRGISWVIVGGESGWPARPLHVEWVRVLIAQCATAGVSVFCKQLGKEVRLGLSRLPMVGDPGHGGDMQDWPDDLRVRQFPATEVCR